MKNNVIHYIAVKIPKRIITILQLYVIRGYWENGYCEEEEEKEF